MAIPNDTHSASSWSAPVAKPITVKISIITLWVGVAFQIVVFIISLVQVGALSDVGESSAAAEFGGIVAGSSILLAIQIAAMVLTSKGMNWARIALVVFVGLVLVANVIYSGQLNVGDFIAIAAMVLLFVPASNEWFRAQQ